MPSRMRESAILRVVDDLGGKMTRAWIMILGLGLAVRPTLGQYAIGAGPRNDDILGGVYGEIYSVAAFTISVPGNPSVQVKFKLDRVVANTPNFLVVSP